MITVVLNAFKRQQYLKQQIDCVLSQTVPAERVLIWNNGAELDLHGYGDKLMVANNSHNLGVWSRFAYAINAETEYVCMLDDDTFPAPRFFESCLQQMEREPALLGARGLRFLSAARYHPFVSLVGMRRMKRPRSSILSDMPGSSSGSGLARSGANCHRLARPGWWARTCIFRSCCKSTLAFAPWCRRIPSRIRLYGAATRSLQ